MVKYLRDILLICGLLVTALLNGQNVSNPFELVPRLSPEDRVVNRDSDLGEEATAGDTIINPFDLIEGRAPNADIVPYEIDTRIDPIITSDRGRFNFFAIALMLLLLASGVSLVGTNLNKSFQSFINDNAFNQYFREQEGRGAFPYFILYALFFINLGLFLILLLNYLEIQLPWSSLFLSWLIITGALAGLFLLKQLVLIILSWVFPIENEVRRYIFLILVFSITIGTLLVPLNLLFAYGPEGSEQTVLYVVIGLFLLIYLFRSLRALLIANKFLAFHRFHFLLYICTVEIAPVLIIVRLILNQL